MTFLVDAHFPERLGIAHPVPDEIVATMTRSQIVVEPRNRISDHLLARGEKKREIGKDAAQGFRRKVDFTRRAAPDVIPGINGLHFGGELRAHAGTNTIAAHEQITLCDM